MEQPPEPPGVLLPKASAAPMFFYGPGLQPCWQVSCVCEAYGSPQVTHSHCPQEASSEASFSYFLQFGDPPVPALTVQWGAWAKSHCWDLLDHILPALVSVAQIFRTSQRLDPLPGTRRDAAIGTKDFKQPKSGSEKLTPSTSW